MPGAAAVVLGAGSGSRLGGDANKIYLPLAGRRLVSYALNAFLASAQIDRVVLVVRSDEQQVARRVLEREVDGRVGIVVGGATRHDSERAALRVLEPEIADGAIDVVAIHDGARPLLSARVIDAVVSAARLYGAAVPALAVDDLVDLVDGGIADANARSDLVRVQTPQAFRADALVHAYRRAEVDGFTGTDTASCVERYGGPVVHCVPGDPRNIKITYARDLFLAEQLLADSDYHLE